MTNKIASGSRLLTFVILAAGAAALTSCSSNPSSSGPLPYDLDRDGLISKAEYNAEMARLERESVQAKRLHQELLGGG